MERPFIILLTLLLSLVLLNPIHAEITSLTIIDVSTNEVFEAIVPDTTYPRESLPASLSLRADVTNPADTQNVQFVNDITGDLIRQEGIAPYAINGDAAGVFRPWSVPLGLNTLRIVQNLKDGTSTQQIISFTIGDAPPTPSASAGTIVTPTPSASASASVSVSPSAIIIIPTATPPTPTPTPTPTPSTPTTTTTTSPPSDAITFTWIDAAADTDFAPIIDGNTYSRTSLPSSISIRADITNTPGSNKNSVNFFINNVKIRTENIAPYAIAGDQSGAGGSNYFPWNGLPDNGEVMLKAEQIADSGIVATVTITFNIGDVGETVSPSPSVSLGVTASATPSTSVVESATASPSISVGETPSVSPTVSAGELTATPSASVSLGVTPSPSISTVATGDLSPTRINLGGPNSVVSGYEPDSGITFVGSPNTSGAGFEIEGTELDAVYNSHRWQNSFGLTLVVDGPKKITLGFAERYVPACGTGLRVFSVTVGDQSETNIDVFTRAGDCNTAYDLVFDNVMPDAKGVIQITFLASVQNAMVSLINIDPVGDTTTPTPTITESASVTPSPGASASASASITPSPGASASASVSVTPSPGASMTPTPTGTIPILGRKINFGRPAEVDGYEGDADINFTGAPKNSIENVDIVGTELDAVYNSHRWASNFGFSVAASEAVTIVLGFAETYNPACVVGGRIFTATVGSQSVSNIDVFAEVGCETIYNVIFEDVVPDVDGSIQVNLAALKQNAMISSIQVGGDIPSPTPTASVGSETTSPTPSALTLLTQAKINVGGPAADGFEDDSLLTFTGEPSISTSNLYVAGTSFQTVYKSQRSAQAFGFPLLVDGPKDIVLGFAEMTGRLCNPFRRVFTITVGDQTVNNFDVYARAKCEAAYNLEFNNVAPDAQGIIQVTFNANIQNAMLSSVEIYPANTPAQSEGPSPSPVLSNEARWEIVPTTVYPNERHEACFVMGDNGKAYLLGGRGIKPVNVFDPATNLWTQEPGPGVELHHMQCLAYDNKIWIGSSWTGGFPTESNVPLMYIYDTTANSWSTKPGLPSDRLRGGGAFVLHDNKMWLAMGNRGGHGGDAQTLGWLDMFDPTANGGEGMWSNETLPDAPNPRDHTAGGIVNNKLCIGGGRDGGAANFFQSTVAPVNCYNFETGAWEVGPDIPDPRAGASVGVNCDGELVVAGGEAGRSAAYSEVSIFNGEEWRVGAPLFRARHGSGLAVNCPCGKIYIASGSGARGGSPELSTVEVYLPEGDFTPAC